MAESEIQRLERMAAEHNRLEDLMRAARVAFDGGDGAAAFAEFHKAILEHMTEEDRHFRATPVPRDPEDAGLLADIIEQHRRIRITLDELAETLAREGSQAARPGFTDFIAAFTAHEAHEERLIASIRG